MLVRRLTLGLVQAEVARRAGITQTRLSKIEKGAVDVRISTLQDIARALHAELILVPRELVPTLEGLMGEKQPTDRRPLFEIDVD